ncbi:MAG TPA: hypothetical protein VLK33_05870 [Terriglobales bacterium]|nr:hypothetical protein [Terriglobales bacterium]
MIWGLSTSAFTQLHVIISLIGIGSGLLVAFGLVRNKRYDGATAIFLATTLLTSVTGFAFPNEHITPGIKIGIISCVLLAFSIIARYITKLGGVWRAIYVITAMIAQFLNCFVLVVQLFEKVPSLKSLGLQPPFLAVQVPVLIVFVVLTVLGVKNFRPVA